MARHAPRSTAKKDNHAPYQEQILAALQEDIEPAKTTFAFQLGLFAVTIANLLLPVLYFGLIFLVAHGLYWNFRYNDPRGGFKPMVYYFGAYVAGGITLVFLVKPLFARGPKESPPLKLKRSAEPFLYEYVEAICDVVHAPVPSSIRLTCDPNAGAGFTRGLMGLVTGRMTLTIGLTLVAGMSVRQLTGILAHEFGHFSQGTSMRMSFIVRVINYWLLKIVCLRDRWDEKLDELSGDIRLKPILAVARFCVWLSRQLLFGLLWLGNAISCFLMRQMEFDADRYEARVVGFRTFTSSCNRLSDLCIAHQMALGDLHHFHSEGRLADNLPALIVSNVPHITAKFRKEVRKMQREQQAGLFDTHPTDRDRIENVRQETETGIFQLPGDQVDLPATVLFANFEQLCRFMTADYYKCALGTEFKNSLLYPVEQLVKRRDAELKAGKSLDRYFQVHIPVDRPLPIGADSHKPPARPQQALQELKETRAEMLRQVAEYKRLTERYEQTEQTLFLTLDALSVRDCGLSIRGKDFGLPDNRLKTAEEKHKRARAAVQHLAARMLTFENAASERMTAALRLLQVPKVSASVPEGDVLRDEVRELIPDALLVSEIIGELPALRILYRRTAVLFSRLGKRNNGALIEKIIGQLEGISRRLNSIHDQLEGKRYPLDHADEDMTLQKFVIPYVPEPLDVGGLVGATQYVVDRLFTLQVRLFAKLTHAAEKVESALGLPMLDDPSA